MADHPEIAAAKARIRELVPGAVEVLGDLVNSEHDGIKLGAAREILDRGGVPAKAEVHVAIDLTLDEEIETMLRSLKRNADRESLKEELEVEDAIVVEELGAGGTETVFEGEGVLPGEAIAEPEPEPFDQMTDVHWQAKPAT